MYFKNKETGITWHIVDKNHIKRLENDTAFEEVVIESTSKNTKQPDNTGTVDYKAMEWQELRSLASQNGINVNGMKRKQIEKELQESGDTNVTK